MKYKIRRLIPLFLLIAVVGGWFYGGPAVKDATSDMFYREGLRTLDDVPFTGQELTTPVIIDIAWAEFCVYCKAEIEYLRDADLPSELVTVILVNVKDSKRVVERYIEENNLPDEWIILIGGQTPNAQGTVPHTRVFSANESGKYEMILEFIGWNGNELLDLVTFLKEYEL